MGIAGFASKPLKREELLEAIGKALAGRPGKGRAPSSPPTQG